MTDEAFPFDTAVSAGLASALLGCTGDALDNGGADTLGAAESLALAIGQPLDFCFGLLLAMTTVAAQSEWTPQTLRQAADKLSETAEMEATDGK